MKKRAVVFYISEHPGPHRQEFYFPHPSLSGAPPIKIYIRTQVWPAGIDAVDALDQAKPKQGESVMNSHMITVR